MPIGRGGGIDGLDEDGGSGLTVAELDPVVPDAAVVVELPTPDLSDGWVLGG